jgi:hypothetical protein
VPELVLRSVTEGEAAESLEVGAAATSTAGGSTLLRAGSIPATGDDASAGAVGGSVRLRAGSFPATGEDAVAGAAAGSTLSRTTPLLVTGFCTLPCFAE